HDRIAGAAALPGVQELLRAAPAHLFEARIERSVRRLRKVKEQVMGEFAPAELTQIGVATRANRRFVAERGQELSRTDLAEVQVRRPRRGARAIRPVSLRGVLLEARTIERLEPCVRSLFSRCPLFGEASVPMDTRQEIQARELHRSRPLRRTIDARR